MSKENRVGLAYISNINKRESPYSDIANISALIRDAARQAGFGNANPESPFTDIVKPGMTV